MSSQFHPRKQPIPPDPKNWKPHTEDKSWIFISQAIDEYGLDPYEFRILAHVARRAGKDICYASQETIANACGINKRKVMKALQTLCDVGIIKKTRTGRSNHYTLQESGKWEHPSKLQALRSLQKQ